MSSIVVLTDAKHLLEDYGWTKGAFARDKTGKSVPVLAYEADSFDVGGAIVRAAGGINSESELASDAFAECLDESIPAWQDKASYCEVIACMDETIATLRSRRFTE